MNRKSNDGFTLIELIIVIAVLGILAAVALPKFADLTTEAQNSAFDGVYGGFGAAIQITHAKWLAAGQTSPVSLDNGASVIVNSSGWPTIDSTAGTTQDTAAELYALIMTGSVPTGWTSMQTAAMDAGSATFEFTAKANPDNIRYEATNGKLCSRDDPTTACP
jgi:prepilin-type N-terminal cleavage/methylation domain-containing protein